MQANSLDSELDMESVQAETAVRATVLGIGNILLGDDGVGIAVVEALRDELSAQGVKIVDGGTLSYTLLPLIEDTNVMITVDAGRLGSVPGSVSTFKGAAMDEYLGRASSGTVHEVSLRDLMDMARLRDSLPEHRALVAIQPDSVDWGSTLTPRVAEAVPVAADAVRRLLEVWQ